MVSKGKQTKAKKNGGLQPQQKQVVRRGALQARCVLSEELRAMAMMMACLANRMARDLKLFSGPDAREVATHADELCGAAKVMAGWAKELASDA